MRNDGGRTTERALELPYVIVGLLLMLVYAGAVFRPALLDDADATHAEAAREMAESGDWVTLHVNGIRYLEKAPLPYWLVATSYAVFGPSAASTRLPLLLALVALAGLVWTWAHQAFGVRAAWYGCLMLASSVGVFLFTRFFIPEVVLGLFILLAQYGLLRGLYGATQRARWIYVAYAAMAAATLTKGLIGIVFALAPFLLFLLLTGQLHRWRELRPGLGLLLFVVLAAPWHILAAIRNEGFLWFYFVNEHVLRFLGLRYPKDYNRLPALAYWAGHLIWLFPYSFFLPLLVRRWPLRQELARARHDFGRATLACCSVTALFILAFFAFSTNQEYYTFPVYAPVVLVLAAALSSEEAKVSRAGRLRAIHAVLMMVGLAAAASLAGLLWQARGIPYMEDVGAVLVRRGVGQYTLSMSQFFDLTTEAFAGLRLPAWLALAVLAGGPTLAFILRFRRQDRAATLALVATSAAFLAAAAIAFARFEPVLSSKPLADLVATRDRGSVKIVFYGDQAYGSSLLFYARPPVYLVNGRSSSMEFGSRFPDAPDVFWSEADLLSAWAREPTILFVPAGRQAAVENLLPSWCIAAERGGKSLYTNVPRSQLAADMRPPRCSK